jgi:hypothetical protein
VNTDEIASKQKRICERYSAAYNPPPAHSTLGLAIVSLGNRPTYGLRLLPDRGTNGWYIWCGERSDDPDFFKALHHEHLSTHCPAAVPFLALPSGFGFVVDGDYVDVLFDEKLLKK